MFGLWFSLKVHGLQIGKSGTYDTPCLLPLLVSTFLPVDSQALGSDAKSPGTFATCRFGGFGLEALCSKNQTGHKNVRSLRERLRENEGLWTLEELARLDAGVGSSHHNHTRKSGRVRTCRRTVVSIFPTKSP